MTKPPAKTTPQAEVSKPQPGHTTPMKNGDRSPKLPHERDESSESQASTPRRVIRQAHEDLKRGLVDTDRGPVVDEVYEHHVRPGGGSTRDRGEPDPTPDAAGAGGKAAASPVQGKDAGQGSGRRPPGKT